jgi:hypothetical protein
MAHNGVDGQYSFFAPSKVTSKFQTFLLGPPPSPPAIKRSLTAGRQPAKGKLSRRRPRPGFTSSYSSFHRAHKGATAPTQRATAMAIEIPSDPQHGILKPVHINTDEVPWSVSVAENDSASFSIYVKSTFDDIRFTRLTLSTCCSSRFLRPVQPRRTISPSPARSKRSAICIGR